jgi:MYXO-CTERM domain-containing protein
MIFSFQRAQAVNVLITVDNTGANIPVSTSAPRTWNFAIKEGYSFTVGRSLFGLNDGNQTSEPIIFSVWQGLGGNQPANTLLTTVSLTPAQVDGFYTTLEEFSFVPLTLTAGYYSVTLTSIAPDSPANKHYFLKSGRAVLMVDNANVDGSTDTTLASTAVTLGYEFWDQDSSTDGTATTTFQPAPVPEPSSVSLALLAALPLLRRRRF